jgi:diguanylate cyclase (GGDEF)-like protein
MDSGLFWSTCACLLAVDSPQLHLRAAYFTLAGLVLGIAVIETSYQIAYRDELTGLPGRRALNRAMGDLGDEYSIAMVDIDHFKQFNDTFGHDVGDQVLRMVASKLAKVGGDGTAFRCGGEEFAVVFPGGLHESIGHAEVLRQGIEQARFVVRGPERSHRRRKERRHRLAKRSLGAEAKRTTVTVSIGIAGPNATVAIPEQVIQAADKALYRAKESGRNRVEIFAGRRAARTRPQRSGMAIVRSLRSRQF